MPPLERLDDAAGVHRGFRPGVAAVGPERQVADRGKVLRTYKWFQFKGKEEVTEFDEAHFKLEGQFAQSSSAGHKDYSDRLRAIHLRKEGKEKAAIAEALGRSEKFVAKWWQKDNKEVPRPWGVHDYLTKELGMNEKGVGKTNGATAVEDTAVDTATWWRDIEVRRGYAVEPEIYDEIVQNTEWKGSPARTRDFQTGAYHLKYDRHGNTRMFGHQNGKYKQGLSPALDKCMQKLFAQYGIAERTSGIITNWYPDGDSYLGSHRHDCWTALFSFGQERILTVDNTPILMQSGDLCIFGTQRHGVPFMPEITEGRITVVVFFYPNAMQKKMMWETISDPETMAPSKPLVTMLQDRDLGAVVERRTMETTQEVQALLELGFSYSDAQDALRASGFEVERAAELLLLAGKASSCGVSSQDEASAMALGIAAPAPQSTKGGRFRSKAKPAVATEGSVPSCSSSEATTADGSASQFATSASGASSSAECCDEELARRMQLEDCGSMGVASPAEVGAMSESEVAALAAHLDEMEGLGGAGEGGMDPTLLAAQFQEYESRFNKDDNEHWSGEGDLMFQGRARENLAIDSMDKVTIYSVGHGDMLEKDFFQMLQCQSIRVLYDIRATDYRGELHSRHARFSVDSLRSACRARGVVYKPMPIGRESAYGTLTHVESDEGQHTLTELVWQAKRKRTAFLGSAEWWMDDPRQVAAEKIAKAGHVVDHMRADGSAERHAPISKFPDWLVREADRLKMLEKKRDAGELVRPQKSRTDRSSEAVAARLATPAVEVDAMEEMRGAKNQKELIVAQRKLARYQRQADEKGALAGKVVKGAPEWIAEDARKQAEWVAGKQKEKEAKEKGQATGAPSAATKSEPSPAHGSASAVEMEVECRSCSELHPWTMLEQGDGLCPACRSRLAGASSVAAAEGCMSDAEHSLAYSAEAPAATVGEEAEEITAEDADCGGLPKPGAATGSDDLPRRSSWRGRRHAASNASPA